MSRGNRGTHLDQVKHCAEQAVARQSLLWAFLALSMVASWTVWLWPVNSHPIFELIVLGHYVSFSSKFLLLLTGNCLPGFFAVFFALLESKQQFKSVLLPLTTWGVRYTWYLAALALPCAVYLLSLGTVYVYFLPYPRQYHFPSVFDLSLSFLLTLPFGPVWEEIAWRSYTLTKLEQRYSLLKSALIVGVYWACWHIPLWVIQYHSTANMIAFELLMGFIAVIAGSIIFAWFYRRSGRSLPIVIFLHGAYVSMSQYAGAVNPRGNHLLIAIATAVWAFLGGFFATRLDQQNHG